MPKTDGCHLRMPPSSPTSCSCSAPSVCKSRQKPPELHLPRTGLPISTATRRLLSTVRATNIPISDNKLAARYADALRRTALPYPTTSLSLPPIPRFSALNTYLLDGYIYSSVPCTASCSLVLSKDEISRNASTPRWQDIATQIALTAFKARCAQQYLDGNHRTAILYMFEMCADFDRRLEVDPLLLYTVLSCRGYFTEPQEVVRKLAAVIAGARVGDVGVGERGKRAALVKELPRRTSIYFEFLEGLKQRDVEGRVRQLKGWKREKREYGLLRKCFGGEVDALMGGGRAPSRARREAFMQDCLRLGIVFVISED